MFFKVTSSPVETGLNLIRANRLISNIRHSDSNGSYRCPSKKILTYNFRPFNPWTAVDGVTTEIGRSPRSYFCPWIDLAKSHRIKTKLATEAYKSWIDSNSQKWLQLYHLWLSASWLLLLVSNQNKPRLAIMQLWGVLASDKIAGEFS